LVWEKPVACVKRSYRVSESLEMEEDELAITNQRDRLQSILLEKISGLLGNGDINSRLAGNLHISIPNIPNSAVIAKVRSKLAISTGAACSSGIEAPSLMYFKL